MTIPIKIECGCGQHYAFDVEPVNGRMTSSVACPVCGADGTAAADTAIAQSMPVAAEPAVRLRVAIEAGSTQSASSAPVPAPASFSTGLFDPVKATAEARSKILWGDPPEDVVKFLLMNSFTHEDASAAVAAMVNQRKATLRGMGIWKIVFGIGLMAVPVVTFLIMMYFHLIITRLLALTIMVGLYGGWMLFKGLIMVFVPKLETGDVADQ